MIFSKTQVLELKKYGFNLIIKISHMTRNKIMQERASLLGKDKNVKLCKIQWQYLVERPQKHAQATYFLSSICPQVLLIFTFQGIFICLNKHIDSIEWPDFFYSTIPMPNKLDNVQNSSLIQDRLFWLISDGVSYAIKGERI